MTRRGLFSQELRPFACVSASGCSENFMIATTTGTVGVLDGQMVAYGLCHFLPTTEQEIEGSLRERDREFPYITCTTKIFQSFLAQEIRIYRTK